MAKEKINLQNHDEQGIIRRDNAKSVVFNLPELNGMNKSCLGYYFPRSRNRFGHKNSLQDGFSKCILSLKNSNRLAIDYFYNRIAERLSDNQFVVVAVPPHTQGFPIHGIGILAKKLAENHPNIIDGTRCLYRYETIEALNQGGKRDKRVHLSSIRVDNEDLIKNQHVLLLDDIYTTGNSLDVCRELLEGAGAKTVKPYVLGKTQREYIGHPENYKLNRKIAEDMENCKLNHMY